MQSSTLKLICLLIPILLFGCDNSENKNTNNPNKNEPTGEKLLTKSQEFKDLANLLAADKLDEFYQGIKQNNIEEVRRFFEDKAKHGESYNYGVLINADIITASNKSLFKPDLNKINSFTTVPNESRCFMNSALYDIANSAFFDDFLEIDKIFPKDWDARNKDNLKIANPIIRTLREVIYEIRRGEKTTPELIAKMRKRHIERFFNLNDVNIITDIYRELIASYDFGQIEIAGLNAAGNKVNIFSKYNISALSNEIDLQPVIEKYSDDPEASEIPYGHLGLLSCALGGLKSGTQDYVYLTAIFPIIDPFGKVARYMSAAIFKNINEKDLHVYSRDIWRAYFKEPLVFKIKNHTQRLKLVHNDLVFYNNHLIVNFSYHLRSPFSQETIGAILLHTYKYWEPNFDLIAKSRGSYEGSKGIGNHEIAEVYIRSRKQWEVLDFFNQPTFSTSISTDADGLYKDYLYYFERK